MALAQELSAGLAALRDGLVAHCRLSALALLAEPRLLAQRDRARDAVVRIEQAALLQDHLARYFGARPPRVAWLLRERPDLLALLPAEGQDAQGQAAPEPINAALAALSHELLARAQALLRKCEASPLCAPAALLLEQLIATLPPESRALPPESRAMRPESRTLPPRSRSLPRRPPARAPLLPTRVLRGPRHVGLDPIFTPSFSLLERPDLIRTKSDDDKAPFYWMAGLRESMAAELCALSLCEYDGLPLQFYRDFAKQAWDELRHALFFIDLGIELLPNFIENAPRGHPLLAGARRFVRTGAGLPCPLERNLYEVAWNTTLPQRLVLMHLDTETPGIARFKTELREPFWKARPRLAEGLRLSTFDEASHARLGRTWLHHLLPERAQRRAEIARTRLLRGALLLAAFSHYHARPMAQLLKQVARARVA